MADKIHYKGTGASSKPGCSVRLPKNATSVRHHVTCKSCLRVLVSLGWEDLRSKLKPSPTRAARPVHPLFPVGSRVVLIESGAAGRVAAHVKANLDDRPSKKAHKVRWDSHGTTSYVRPGRLRLESENPV